jgi:lipopolysaccharide transport system ATP-binding protein
VSDVVIRAEGLEKRYRIGGGPPVYATLSEAVARLPARLFQRRQVDVISALDGVSFTVREGEAVGVIGSNGAGKTTLLRVLTRITAPSAGWAEIRGRVGSLLDVGAGFHPELTGRENVFLNGAILGMTRREVTSRFDEIVEFAEVSRFVDTPVKRYSTGMYLRLAFAVAAHLAPDVLLVDEVLAVGDASFQKKCLGKMGEAARSGRTVLFVSHNLASVKQLCSRGLLFDAGRLAFDGTSAEAISRYAEGATRAAPTCFEKAQTMFSQLRLEGADGNVLPAGAAFGVACNLRLARGVAGFRVYFLLQGADGERLVFLRKESRDLGGVEAGGAYHLSVSLPALWLRPGTYSAGFELMPVTDDTGSSRIASDRVLLEVPALEAADELRGVLVPAAEWRLLPLDDGERT